MTDVELEGLPNLGSVVFASQEVSFWPVHAAMLDQDQNARFPIRHNGRLSIVAGQEIPSVETSMAGFFQGARYINPYIKVRYGFAGISRMLMQENNSLSIRTLMARILFTRLQETLILV